MMDEEIEIQLTTTSQICFIQWVPQQAYTYIFPYDSIHFSCQLNTTDSLQTLANSPIHHDMKVNSGDGNGNDDDNDDNNDDDNGDDDGDDDGDDAGDDDVEDDDTSFD